MRPGRGAKVPGRAREGGEAQGAGGRRQEAGESPGGHGGIRALEGVEETAGGKTKSS